MLAFLFVSLALFVWAVVGLINPKFGRIRNRRVSIVIWLWSAIVLIPYAVIYEKREAAAEAAARDAAKAAALQARIVAEAAAEAAARAAETPEEAEARKLEAEAREFREEAARAAVARQAAADKIVKARRKLLDDGRIFADIFCAEQVEARARFSARWTNGFLENKFPVGQWQKETASEKIVLYMGDKIEIQNRFGAWQPHLYECLVDVRREKILSVNVVPRS